MIRAAGERIGWADLPTRVHDEVADVVGGRIVSASSQRGGFSPGTADRVVTGDGRRAFAKAVSSAINPRSVEVARQEAAVAGQMPPDVPVPRLLGAREAEGWLVLIFEDVAGAHPRTPWVKEEADAAATALAQIAERLTPSPIKGLPRVGDRLAGAFAGWAELAADPAPDLDPWAAAHLDVLRAAAERGLAALQGGETVTHGDIREDNLLVRPDGSVMVVDWPWASVGPAWLDTVLLAMDVIEYGGDGERLLDGVELSVAVDVCAGFAGMQMNGARMPDPGIAHLRKFQRAQAEALLPWLRTRLAW